MKRSSKSPYIISDGEIDEENYSIKYYFNIGDFHNKKCHNQTSSVTEFLTKDGETLEICENLGQYNHSSISLIDENNPKIGIMIEYENGDICKTSQDEELMGLHRKTRFKILFINIFRYSKIIFTSYTITILIF